MIVKDAKTLEETYSNSNEASRTLIGFSVITFQSSLLRNQVITRLLP
jgi:hypothetical protein